MADNVTLDAGAGGDTIAADDVGGVKYQVVKLDVGADGVAAPVSNSNPVPVSDAGGTLTVDGTVTANLAAGTNNIGDVDVLSIAAGNNNIGDVDIASIAAGDNNIGNVDIVTMPSVTLAASTGTQEVVGDVAHDAPAAGNPVLVAGYASAAAPTDVSGDADAVRAWHLRNGAQATVITAAGALIGGDAANGLDVDITRMAALVASSANIGDVDVLTLPNVTLAAGTNTNEVVGDAAHDAAAAGNPLLMGAYASAAAPSDVSGDADAVRLWALRNGSQVVNIAAGGALIGATSNALDVNIKSGAGSGGTALADDAAFTAATTSFTPVGGIVTADSVDSGDGGAFAMLANRQQKVTLYDSGGVELAVGGGTQYTEDAAAAANPVGNALMLVREDARGGSLTTTDGDNVAARGTNAGELYVKHVDALTVNSHAVTNAGTFAVQATVAAAATNIAKAEDVASADADVGVPAMAVRKATPANTSGTDGDYEMLQMSAGRLWASATIDAALPAGTNAIGKLAANSGVDIGDVDVTSLPNVTLAAGTNTNEVVGDAAHDAAAAGNPLLMGAYASAAAPTDVSADADAVRLWALRNGSIVVNMAYGGTLLTATTTQETVGDVADDAATAGNPVLVAGVAVETDGTDPTTVSAEGDAAYLRTDRARRLLVSQHHPRGWWVSADYGSAQTNASVKAAPGASLSLYITDIVISNGATAGNVTLLDGSGGTVVFEIYPAINGGCTISVKNPIRLTANTALCITSTTVTTHSVNIGGYTAP